MNYWLLLNKFIRKERFLTAVFLFFVISMIVRYATINVPEKIPGGEEIGIVIHNLGLGYYITYFFYFLVSFVKNEKDKNNVNEFLSFNTSLIIIDGYGLLRSLKQESKMQRADITMPPTEDQVKTMLAKLNLDHSPLSRPDPIELAKHLMGELPSVTGKHVDWMEYFRHMKKEAEKPLEKLFELLPYMDSELTRLIYKVRESSLFYTATHLVTGIPPHNGKQFLRDALLKPVHQYLLLIKELEDYVETNFNAYPQHKKLREERK